jgi:hypothetical protein
VATGMQRAYYPLLFLLKAGLFSYTFRIVGDELP